MTDCDLAFQPKARILLVEDDRTHREFIANFLDRIGCDVTLAYEGQDALRQVGERPFDLVLMDLEMPVMNGLEAARRLREMKRHHDLPDIPIIAISSEPAPALRDACAEAGIVDYIPKTLWKPDWEQRIRQRLDRWLPDAVL